MRDRDGPKLGPWPDEQAVVCFEIGTDALHAS